MGIPFTHSQRQRPQGSLGNGERILCCVAATAGHSSVAHVEQASSLGPWTGPATSQEQALCLAVSGAASLVPSGSNINTLVGEDLKGRVHL